MNRAPTGVGWWSLGYLLALREDGLFPTGSPPLRLISPLEQMGQEYDIRLASSRWSLLPTSSISSAMWSRSSNSKPPARRSRACSLAHATTSVSQLVLTSTSLKNVLRSILPEQPAGHVCGRPRRLLTALPSVSGKMPDARCSASVPATPSVPGRSMMSIQPRYRYAQMSQHSAS